MTSGTTRAIEIKSVTKEFSSKTGSLQALGNIDLEIFEGEFVSIIGPSGCGKTTLLRMMAHLETPTSGSVRINGKTPNQARLDRDFAVVFQSPALLDWREALKNVMLPLEMIGVDREQAHTKATEMLEFVGLPGFEHSFPRQLSGGMQQRVSIARALTLNPSILLMDEPFGALDRITRERMNLELLRIWHQHNFTGVFITHNIHEAVMLSTRIVVMTPRPGRIQGILEVDLPRPRTPDMKASEKFIRIELKGEQLLEEGMKNE